MSEILYDSQSFFTARRHAERDIPTICRQSTRLFVRM